MRQEQALQRICVFCGSNPGSDPRFREAAIAFGKEIARRRIHLVFGGGSVGLMGAVADAVLATGGEVDGVIPQFLDRREIAHHGATRLHVVASMHERKALMADLADAFVALPGGIGTVEEWVEALTWTQLGLHAKPVALLDVGGFWRPLLDLLDAQVHSGFLAADVRAAIPVASDPGELIDRLARWVSPALGKWTELPAGAEVAASVPEADRR